MKFGVAQPPLRKAGDKPLTWSGGHSYCLSTGAKDADVGWELGKWLISEEGFIVGYDGNLGRAKAPGGAYVPPMTGQPELDKKMFAKYKTGIAAVDKVPDFAVALMQYSRVREPSIAAQALWDGIKASPDAGHLAGQERQAGPGRQPGPRPRRPSTPPGPTPPSNREVQRARPCSQRRGPALGGGWGMRALGAGRTGR